MKLLLSKISEFQVIFRSSLVSITVSNKCEKALAFRKCLSEIIARSLKPVFEINHSFIYCFNHSPLIDTSGHDFTIKGMNYFQDTIIKRTTFYTDFLFILTSKISTMVLN